MGYPSVIHMMLCLLGYLRCYLNNPYVYDQENTQLIKQLRFSFIVINTIYGTIPVQRCVINS